MDIPMDKMCGIYKIENCVNGKVYIGQSVNIKARWWQHRNRFEKNYKGINDTTPLYRAFNKYGIENFSFSVIELCDVESLDDLEMFYISKYKSSSKEYGYNVQEGGYSRRILDCERKIEISNKLKYWLGKKRSPDTVEKIRKANIGKKYTEEVNKKKGRAGVKLSEETKRKMSEAQKINAEKRGIKKPVRCIETGQIWDSIDSAEKETKDLVGRCCIGRQLNSNGRHYEFVNSKDIEEYKDKIYKLKINYLKSINSIICENTGEWFYSSTDVERKLGINRHSVIKVARHEKNASHGYIFRFLREDEFDYVINKYLL